MQNRCCPNCFGDRGLENNIFPTLTLFEGTCSYCKAESNSLANPSDLTDYFDLIVSAYEEDDADGKTIVEWLIDDWLLFDCPDLSLSDAKILLGDILDDGDIVRKRFKPADVIQSGIANWETLKDELRYKNRYFLDEELKHGRLKELLNYLISEPLDLKWHRARIMANNTVFTIEEMGAPPKGLASHGRANPSGIPYLYVASSPQTAIAELRPHTGEQASVATIHIPQGVVATIHIPQGVKVVDLRNPKKLVSPFLLAETSAVAKLRADVPFLAKLGEELTRPILPRSAAIDYVPSQYLCEFIKKQGFSGVLYRSSVSEGINLALFDVDSVEGVNVRKFLIDKVSVDISESVD